MTRIVTTHYRYKRPPRKRKAVAMEVPAIVTRAKKKPGRVLTRIDTSDEAKPANDDRKPVIVTRRKRPALRIEALVEPKDPPHANEERKSAIVTIRRKPGRCGTVPDMTPEEHKRRGDAADELFREIVRRATSKEPP